MPFVPSPNLAVAEFHFTLNGVQTMDRIHIDALGPVTQAGAQVVADQLAGWWTGNCRTISGGGITLREVVVKSLEVQNGPQATSVIGLPAAGTAVGAMLPGNAAACVSLRTGLTGRSARGRWYWQGLTEAQVVDNLLDAGLALSIIAAFNNLLTIVNALPSRLVIASYISNGVPRPGGPVYFIVTTPLFVDLTIDTQRGRLH